jgi:hypothetical protein
MAWRPRKSISLGKGFRINLSKRGIGWSAGIPGLFRFGVGSDGRGRSSFGTGLLRHEFHHGKVGGGSGGGGGGCGCFTLVVIVILGLGVVGAIIGPSGTTHTDAIPAPGKQSGLKGSPPRNPSAATPPSTDLPGPKAEVPMMIPTPIRTWRSSDGRTLNGRVTEIDPVADTLTMERTDGQVFRGVPISKLHPEEAALLRTAK